MSVRFMQSALSRWLPGAAIVLGLAMPVAAFACDVRIGTLVASPIAYDPFGMTPGEGSLRTTVDLVEGTDCEATVALVDDASAPLRTIRFGDATRPLVYRIEVQPGDGVVAGLSPDLSTVRLTTARPRVTIVWRLLVDQDSVIAAGEYSRIVQAMLRTLDAADTFSARSTLLLRSIARAQANFAGTSSGFASGTSAQAIDLGTLTTGEQRTAMLQVRANTVAHLLVVSANTGHLVGSDSGQARIPYGLAIDGAPVDLSGPSSRTIAPPLTIDGVALELRVTVGEVAGMPSGRYSDTITIDVSP
jgi:hypothetical protein